MSTAKKQLNVIELIPHKSVDHEQDNDKVILLSPKFRNKLLAKHLLPRMKEPHYKIYLDEFGSTVWRLIDGESTVFEIGKRLEKEYGEKVAPVYQRLGMFMNMLAQRHFIKLSNGMRSG